MNADFETQSPYSRGRTPRAATLLAHPKHTAAPTPSASRKLSLLLGILALTVFGGGCSSSESTGGANAWWQPPQGLTWQVQLSDGLDTRVPADVYVVDGEDVETLDLAEAKAAGARLVCYLNGGAWEEWRADAAMFPPQVLGEEMDGWPGEKWLDTRQVDTLIPLMRTRMQRCAERGFDAVDVDNVNGHENPTGFPLTAADQKRYVEALAVEAHGLGLAFGLKNAPDLLPSLAFTPDFAVNEECHETRECDQYLAYLKAGKPVVNIEYMKPSTEVCTGNHPGLHTLFKDLDLSAAVVYCDDL